ncbi:MAG: hypothetical protein FWB91_07970 [Defluviitaleaceae bacterium]|nr:hypothetical protein [Defluviitaleaceae bacterium]
MPILNYTTKINASKTVGEIQEILAKHGALKIMLDYENGLPVALAFQIDTPCGLQSIRLPANAPGVLQAMKDDGVKADEKRGCDVAWRICKDWIEAQMAFVKARQAEMSQIFLPYIITGDDHTVYELFQRRSLLMDGGA